MSAEKNRTIAERIFEELNARDLDGVVSHYAIDCRFHGWASQPLDVEGYKAAMTEILAAFPDSRFPIDDIIAAEDSVAVRHSLQGTHGAPFQGIPATGKPVRVNAIAIFRIENEVITEAWLNADFLGLLQQLGVVPAPAQA